MKRIVGALALLAGVAATMSAQAQAPQASAAAGPGKSHLGFATYVGTFAPVLSLMAFRNGVDPDVRLDPASSFAAEITWALGGKFGLRGVYAGMTHVRTRVNHSSAMVFTGTDEQRMAYSPVNLTAPTLGVMFIPGQPGWLFFRPTLRIGGGVKFYDFQMREIANGVQDPMLDLGFGMLKESSSTLSFMAEARWMPSKFDPKYLPVPLITGNAQLQNDWVLQLGFRLKK
jgi:hypothetical protein